MAQTITTQSITQIFTFPFRDPRWVTKLLIGGAIMFVSPLLLFVPTVFVTGYGFRMMQHIINDREDPSLPEWTDWQGLFVDGTRVIGVGLIYFFPLIVIEVVAFGFMMVPSFLSSPNGGSSDPFSPFIFMGSMVGYGAMVIANLLMFLIGAFVAAAYCHMAAKNSFASAFRIGEWWPIVRANLGGFLISYLLIMALGFVLNMVFQLLIATLILCVVAPFALMFATFYESIVMDALFAVAYRDGTDRLNPAPVIPTPVPVV
jgi:hypothetical protein